VRRILRGRFALGIFEDPYANPDEAATVVRSDAFQQKADEAQRKSIVLLKNDSSTVPLRAGVRIFVDGVSPAVAARYGYVSAADPGSADVCLFRVKVGERPRPAGPRRNAPPPGRAGGFAGPIGPAPVDLNIPEAELTRLRTTMHGKPTIVAIDFDRPYIVTPLAREAGAVLALFGVTDEALLDVVFGRFAPVGKLPLELPASMEAVDAQQEDVPFDSKDPLFRFGAGLTYPRTN
jgi:beta-glucosidase